MTHEVCLICLNPWFISGLIDAEGSLTAALAKSKTSKLGWRIQLRFTILMHIREADLLKQVRDFFNVGNLVLGENQVSYNVNDLKELGIILNHIFSFPLLTFKYNMALIFNIIRNLMLSKAHLTKDGFLIIVAYINCLNHHINPEKLALIVSSVGNLPNLLLPPVLVNLFPVIQSPWWIIGFVAGEGSFTYTFSRLTFYFEISQSSWDFFILNAIITFVGLPSSSLLHESRGISKVRVTKFLTLMHIVIPFFIYYPFNTSCHKALKSNAWLKAFSIKATISSFSVKNDNLEIKLRQGLVAYLLRKLSEL